MTDPIELRQRIGWSLAKVGALVNVARGDGWLEGDQLKIPPAESLIEGESGFSPMQRLKRLGLSNKQLDLLWLLACVELDPTLSRASQELVTNGMQELNPQIAEVLATSVDDRLAPRHFAELVRLGLIEMASGPETPVYRRPLRINDRVMDLARGIWELDREIETIARLWSIGAGDLHETEVSAEVAAALGRNDNILIVVSGISGSGRATSIATAAGIDRTLLVVDGASLSTDRAVLQRQFRALARESRLHGALLVLRNLEAFPPDLVRAELLDAAMGPVLATARDVCTWVGGRPVVNIAKALPSESQRSALWTAALPGTASAIADECAARYTVSPGVIQDAAKSVIARGRGDATVADVHLALRERLERGLVGIAKRIETKQTWNDLVLPNDQIDLVEEMIGRVRCRSKVLDTWGFADKVGRGIGLAALFSGPPGTGKTMIAGLIAKELELDLYQIDLSKIVSKYIGETEKQLSQVFDAAETGHAILLFDEADSLFGKRSAVNSSNDRYANLETNYLLQRIEAFTGITLLTSNHETSIDPAFQRRLSVHLRIPLPEEKQRKRLWETMIPKQAEVAGDLDFAALAQEFVMSGGYIKNAVLRAAYSAAATNKVISQDHLRRAAKVEYEAMGRIIRT